MLEILFVHPDDRLSSLYRQRLMAHFKVHTASDGLSAVRKIRAYSPKLIISDYHLPFISGKSLIRFVRNFKPTAFSPFIFLSSADFDGDVLGLGANDWIPLSSASPDLIIEKTYYYLKLK